MESPQPIEFPTSFRDALADVIRFSCWLTIGLYAALEIVIMYDRELVQPFFEPGWLLIVFAVEVLVLWWLQKSTAKSGDHQ